MKTLTVECQSHVSEIVEKAVGCLGATQHNISTREFLNLEFAGSTQHLPPSGQKVADRESHRLEDRLCLALCCMDERDVGADLYCDGNCKGHVVPPGLESAANSRRGDLFFFPTPVLRTDSLTVAFIFNINTTIRRNSFNRYKMIIIVLQ